MVREVSSTLVSTTGDVVSPAPKNLAISVVPGPTPLLQLLPIAQLIDGFPAVQSTWPLADWTWRKGLPLSTLPVRLERNRFAWLWCSRGVVLLAS